MANRITLSRPYAKAIFALALKDNSYSKVAVNLEKLANLSKDELFCEMLQNPFIAKEKKITCFLELSSLKKDKLFHNFLAILLDERKIFLLPEIYKLFEQYKREQDNTVQAKLQVAFKLQGKKLKDFQEKLEKKLKQKLELTVVEDASLIAGGVLTVGDKVINSSMAGYLDSLRDNLKE